MAAHVVSNTTTDVFCLECSFALHSPLLVVIRKSYWYCNSTLMFMLCKDPAPMSLNGINCGNMNGVTVLCWALKTADV